MLPITATNITDVSPSFEKYVHIWLKSFVSWFTNTAIILQINKKDLGKHLI